MQWRWYTFILFLWKNFMVIFLILNKFLFLLCFKIFLFCHYMLIAIFIFWILTIVLIQNFVNFFGILVFIIFIFSKWNKINICLPLNFFFTRNIYFIINLSIILIKSRIWLNLFWLCIFLYPFDYFWPKFSLFISFL